MQKWGSIIPDLKKAYLRLQLSPPGLPNLLKTYSPECLSEYFVEAFTTPANSEEEKIQLLADLVISLLFHEKKIDLIITKALPEIEQAYNEIMKSGSGWSSNADKDNPEKRKEAVLHWYMQNHARLSYLKITYLDDDGLYEGAVGQEKRNFFTKLLMKIIKDRAGKDLSFERIKVHRKHLKDVEQLLPLGYP
jgi:hypothetical protein